MINSLHCDIFLLIIPLCKQIIPFCKQIVPFCMNLTFLRNCLRICINCIGENLDYVCNINLDRYVDLPRENVHSVNTLPKRKNQDKHVNMYGTILLTLCKENSLVIVNGRLLYCCHCVKKTVLLL